MKSLTTKITAVFGMSLVLSLAAYDAAEARRKGSFGSRGARTYQAPASTNTAPQATAPIQRSMTPQAGAQPGAQPGGPAAAPGRVPAQAGAQAQAPRRGGFLGGLGGGILGGLLAGGLIGMLMGNGFGNLGAGLGAALLQMAVIGGIIMLVMMVLRRRRAAAQPAGMPREAASGPGPSPVSFGNFGGGQRQPEPEPVAPAYEPRATYTPQTPVTEDIGLVQSDRDTFERLLSAVQDAFAREDYAGLRAITTPEVMSYLSEELSQNAVQGRRNDVSATKLLQADIAEAWREGEVEYATAAMRYESIDIMRDRNSGAVVEGDPDRPTETTELWTFVRHPGADWKLSAIQEA